MPMSIPKRATSAFAVVTMLCGAIVLCLTALPIHVSAAWGVTTTTAAYTIDTGAGTVFSIRRQALSNQKHIGDISSLKINGVEFQDVNVGSQLNTGLSASTSLALDTSVAGFIKVTAVDGSDYTHYYIAKQNDPNIYMGTYITAITTLTRYIARLSKSLLPNGPSAANVAECANWIEASDVCALSNGQTRSKHYSNHRQMDWWYVGATGSGVGVFIVKGNNEGMSGGPFYRSLLNQGGADQEIYNIISYGEAQTEAFRLNILNLYALVITSGSTPSAVPDFSFMSGLGLRGYVGSSGRGNVLGVGITPLKSGKQYVVGFANSAAQYWTTATSSGSWSSYGMLPGTYTMTIYKGELAVYTGSATVTAGQSLALHTITVTDPSDQAALWRIGDWDGTPNEFLNANKLVYMHPSDVRMSSWGPVTFNANTGSASAFPCVQFRGANSPTTITFTLTAAQAAAAHVLNIAITTAYINGRPSVTINGNTLKLKSAVAEPDSRTITVGSYRGNNAIFSWTVPASSFVTGTNTMTVAPISGSTDPGTYLSASYTYDTLELLA